MNNIYLTSVTNKKNLGTKNSPAILFFAEWLRPMGFVPNALVQFVPENDGAVFRLCNENIALYSELFEETEKIGGVLIHAKMYRHRYYPCLSASGNIVRRTGLMFGDNLIARYEYGFIRLRKLPEGRIKIVTSRIFGKWLDELGFVCDAVLTIKSDPDLIICELQENGAERTGELVKYARDNKLNLLQVHAQRDNNNYQQFEIPQSRFIKAGFAPDSAYLATYEYGRIQLQRLDFEALGF